MHTAEPGSAQGLTSAQDGRSGLALRVALFCQVLDHFGDIGVSLRLARSLRAMTDWQLALFCDQRPLADMLTDPQRDGVCWQAWPEPQSQLDPLPDVIINAFGCELPEAIREQMRQRKAEQSGPEVLWIHLDYLSAEAWVNNHHGLHSYKADGLVQVFVFPGFGPDSGGLPGGFAQLHPGEHPTAHSGAHSGAHSNAHSGAHSSAFPGAHRGLDHAVFASGQTQEQEALKVFAYVYETAALAPWLGAIDAHIDLRMPQSQLSPALLDALRSCGQICVRGLAPCPQWQWDEAMQACDLLWVRGEDSWVQAMRSGIPWLWQPYPQTVQTLRGKCEGLTAQMDAVLEADPAWPCWRDALQAWALGEVMPAAYRLLCQDMQAWRRLAGVWAAHCNSLPRLDRSLCHMIETHHQAISTYTSRLCRPHLQVSP